MGLPRDMIYNIISFLDIEDKLRLSCVNKHIYNELHIIRLIYFIKYYNKLKINNKQKRDIFVNIMANIDETDFFKNSISYIWVNFLRKEESTNFRFNNPDILNMNNTMFKFPEDKDTNILEYIYNYINENEGDIIQVCKYILTYFNIKYAAYNYLVLYILMRNNLYPHNVHDMNCDMNEFILEYFLADDNITMDDFKLCYCNEDYYCGCLDTDEDVYFKSSNILCTLIYSMENYGDCDTIKDVKDKLSNIFGDRNIHIECELCDYSISVCDSKISITNYSLIYDHKHICW